MSVKKVKDTMSKSLERVQREFDSLPEFAYRVWLEATPIGSGDARRNTRLESNQIHADYQYASALDSGSSPQAPDGMSNPTGRAIRDRVSRIRK